MIPHRLPRSNPASTHWLAKVSLSVLKLTLSNCISPHNVSACAARFAAPYTAASRSKHTHPGFRGPSARTASRAAPSAVWSAQTPRFSVSQQSHASRHPTAAAAASLPKPGVSAHRWRCLSIAGRITLRPEALCRAPEGVRTCKRPYQAGGRL